MNFENFYIDGRWVEPRGDQRITVINPATEAEVARVPAGTNADVDLAAAAARRAFQSWRFSRVSERASFLREIANGLKARGKELARTITMEMGMPAKISHGYQVEPPIMIIDSFVEILEDYPFKQPNKSSISLLEPVGVCALITPWNFPLTQTMLKLAPALAAGCTVIWKPSEYTPLSATILAEIIDAAGLPAGVFNLVHGTGTDVGVALAKHPNVDMVSLTGSTRAGVDVARNASARLKHVALELGGKSPNIICDDADFEKAIPSAVNKCFTNSGQACDAPTRLLVPRAKYAIALELGQAAAESLRTGDPNDENTDLGPLVNQKQHDRVTGYIRTGIKEGAKVLTGGPEKPEALTTGYYARPTVFADVDNKMQIAQEEIFGPVLCVIPYENDDDAIRIANDTQYGLAAYISSGDEERAASLAGRLEAGQIRINEYPFDISAPFGGYKMSGYGRELGKAGLEEYLQIKTCMGLPKDAF